MLVALCAAGIPDALDRPTAIDDLAAAVGADVVAAVQHLTAAPGAAGPFAAGNAFTAVPPGFDAYLLVNVLHDWDDTDAGRLLGNIAAVAGPRTRVIVVEGERPRRPRAGLTASADVLMAALTEGGRERDRSDISALAAGAGATPSSHDCVGLG